VGSRIVLINNAVWYKDYVMFMVDEWHFFVWIVDSVFLTGENQNVREKPVPVPFHPPQISRGREWVYTQDAKV
jgi:hypothetical protein